MIRSGCIEKSIQWWQENITRCAEEHGYTPDQVKEYELYVDMLVRWFDVYGEQIVKEEKK